MNKKGKLNLLEGFNTDKKIWIVIVGVVLVVFCTLAISGCINQDNNPNGVKSNISRANDNKIVVRDILDREIVLDGPTERIATQWSGAGGAFMTLAALDKDHFQDRIVALDTSLQETRKDMWDQYSRDVPELREIPTIGWLESNEFSVEKLISLDPDVLILPTGLKPCVTPTLESQLDQAEIQIVYINYHSQSVEDHIRSTEILGQLIGKEKEAKELNEYYIEQYELVTKRLEKVQKDKPTVYFECGMKGPEEYFTTHGKGYMFGEMIEITKGDNVGKNIVNTQVVSPELVLSSNPDIIIIGGSYWPSEPTSMRLGFACTEEQAQKSLNSFTKRNGWDRLTAVKNKEVYSVHMGLAREMCDFVLIQQMAKMFYLDEFEDIDPEQNLYDFYEKFLPFNLSGTWYVKLE